MKSFFFRLVLTVSLVTCFSFSSSGADLPVLKTGFIFTTHHTPFLVACSKGEAMKETGVYLKPVALRESYELIKDDKPVALLDLVVAKSGSEAATLFAQKHLDIGLASITAIMAGIDKGTPIKILCPLQTEGMGLIAPKGSSVKTLDEFITKIKSSGEPVKVGFHSPTSAPKIVFEGAMRQNGFTLTLDPSDLDADILLVDLKETSNLLVALSTGQVDAVVGPSPFPEIAITKNAGQMICELRDLPPSGKWHNFPCCVVAATDAVAKQHPKVVEAFVELIVKSNKWANANRKESGKIAAQWLGLPSEAGQISNLVFMERFTDSWLAGAKKYMSILSDMNKLKGSLKNAKFEKARPLLFDTTFLQQVTR